MSNTIKHLYDLPRNTKFTLPSMGKASPIFTLEKIDGMYSMCWEGERLHHLAATTEVMECTYITGTNR